MKYLILILTLLAFPASAETRKVPTSDLPVCGFSSTQLVPCIPGGSNFTADSDFTGCWLTTSTAGETAAEADNCTADASTENMVYTGTFAAGGSVPAGSGSKLSVALDGSSEFFSIADSGSDFEAANFTLGCWLNDDLSGTHVMLSKNDATDYEIIFASDGSGFILVDAVPEILSAAAITADTWTHVAMRYDATGVSDDATDNAIELFINGVDGCDGACATSTGVDGNTDSFVLGATESGASEVLGIMMECFYAERVLTDAEMAEVFLCGLDGRADGATRDATYSGAQCSSITTCC